MASALAIGLSLAALMWSGAGRCESACRLDAQGSGHVGAVVDGRTMRLTDGREIRLAGLVRPVTPNATSALSALLADREIELRGRDDSPDRYGRQTLFVFLDGAEQPVQVALLARGDAIYSGMVAETACGAELLKAETDARTSRRGVWAASDAIKNAESAGDISALAGQFAVVEGKVVSVRQAGATFYVNFGRRWTEGFAVTISGRMMAPLEAAGLSPKSLENRRIRVRGWVERRVGPQIELFRPGQLEIIADR